MKLIADQLPPEIARQLHPDRRKNEVDYWAARDQLLMQYRDKWIGFADGKVVASGTRAVEVLHAAEATGLHPFFICVGREDQPPRVRRATFAYDRTYPVDALPVISVEFRTVTGTPGLVFDRVIPDTGADVSILPWSDCQLLQLDPSLGIQGRVGGISGTAAVSLGFGVWAWLDGTEYPCHVQADFVGAERILGRDVLNSLDITFRGPAGEVIVNP